jgi:hypothetical protein
MDPITRKVRAVPLWCEAESSIRAIRSDVVSRAALLSANTLSPPSYSFGAVPTNAFMVRSGTFVDRENGANTTADQLYTSLLRALTEMSKSPALMRLYGTRRIRAVTEDRLTEIGWVVPKLEGTVYHLGGDFSSLALTVPGVQNTLDAPCNGTGSIVTALACESFRVAAECLNSPVVGTQKRLPVRLGLPPMVTASRQEVDRFLLVVSKVTGIEVESSSKNTVEDLTSGDIDIAFLDTTEAFMVIFFLCFVFKMFLFWNIYWCLPFAGII